MSKVFYLHTPPELKIGGRCLGHRATIACTIEGEHIKYGYAICSTEDNFSRAAGRAKAEARMKAGQGAVEIQKTNWFQHFPTPEAALLEFATTMGRSIRRNYEKYKRKLENYNKAVTAPAAH